MLIKIKFRLEYLFVRLFDGFFMMLPRPMALRVGEIVGLIFSIIIFPRRRLVLENLRLAFPQKAKNEIHGIALAVWRNIGRVAAEFIRLGDINHDNFHDFFILEGWENYLNAKNKKRGVILVGFHFANWEYCGAIVRMMANDSVSIARPIKNPLVNDWVLRKRKAKPEEIIYHRDAVKGTLRALQKKMTIGILVDQNLYHGGVFVDFFGTPAASTTLPALLQERTAAPICVTYLIRVGNKFRFIVEPELQFSAPPTGISPAEHKTQIISLNIEKIITKYPDQWFWIHNRWKRKSSNIQKMV